jgi:hypothetical protein
MARVTVVLVIPGALAVFLDGSPHEAVTAPGAVVAPGAVEADVAEGAVVVAVVVAVEAALLLLLQAAANSAPAPISADSCTRRFLMSPPDPPGPSDRPQT